MAKEFFNLLLKSDPPKKGWPWEVDFSADHHLLENIYPKITIITPSFNQAIYLEETIRSVLLQNYPNLEYIIIDGGSTDNSVEIIKKYDPWITYWVSEPDKGQSEAINKGLMLATGDIINWLNSDDFYEPGVLLKVAAAFQNPEIKVVAGRSNLFKGKNQILYHSNGTDIYSGNLAKTIGWARIDQPETFFRKVAIEKMGLLNTQLHYLMDRDWWIKFLFYFGLDGVVKISDVLVNFRLHDDSKTVSQAKKFIIERDTYYYALAKEYHVNDIADLISSVTDVKADFRLGMKFSDDRELVSKVLHYYLLLRANEFYAQNLKNQTKAILKNIIPGKLNSEDIKLLRKLTWRNRLPKSIINFFRSKN